MQVALRPRSLGEIIGLTFRLGAAHFGTLFPFFLVVQFPATALEIWFPEVGDPRGEMARRLGIALLGLLLGPFQQAFAIRSVAASFLGDRATFGNCLRVALRFLLPVMGLALLLGIMYAIGLLLLIVPAVLFFLWYYVAAPALVVEQIGPRVAMGPSRALTEGSRRDILRFALLFVVVSAVPVALVTSFLPALVENADLSPNIQHVVVTLVSSAASVFGIVGTVVWYFQLRVKKEQLDLQALGDLVARIGERRETTEPSP